MNLQNLLSEAGYDTTSYSGRGMYGSYCLGVTVNNIGKLFADLLSVIDQSSDLEEVSNAFRHMRTDAMGLGTIVYFPTIKYADSDGD